MPKVAIIGAGNVGSLAAMRILDAGLADVVLIDIAKDIAKGKSLDLEDSLSALNIDLSINSTEDFNQVKDADVIVITAGFPRKPGMSRENLLKKNVQIVKDIASKIKDLNSKAVVIILTNPVDMMTKLFYEITNFNAEKLIGFGVSLDSARFANLIFQETKVPVSKIDALVIGVHGKGMLPLARFTKVNGKPLSETFDEKKIDDLIDATVRRGATIVSHLGSGSAYFAPSAAIFNMVKSILKDENAETVASVYLDGQYGLEGIFIGVPIKLGKSGIKEIIELDLNQKEKDSLLKAAQELRECTISA
ncbi:MAG: malate dehydrogenase [Candidatus Omnitrophota bacterium]